MTAVVLAIAYLLPGYSLYPSHQTTDKLRLRIVRIIFDGNRVFSQQELRKQMYSLGEKGLINSMAGRDVYSRDRLDMDLARIRQFLANHGYIRAFVGEPEIQFVHPADRCRTSGVVPIRLVIPIAEGSLYRLRKLSVEGVSVLSNEAARAQFDIHSGDVIRNYLIDGGIARLRHVYGRLGYLRFTATLNFNFQPGGGDETLVDLVVTLGEDKQFRVGRISVRGNVRTKVQVILQMIRLRQGDTFDYPKWEQGLNQINRSGLFDPVSSQSATFTFDEMKGVADVELLLVERKHRRVDVSAGGGSVGGASIGLDYASTNLTGRGDRFSASLRLGNRERSILTDYSTMLLTGTPLRIDVSGFYRRLKFVNARSAGDNPLTLFTERTIGATAGVSLPLSGLSTQAGLFYSFSTTNLASAFAGGVTQGLELSNDLCRSCGRLSTKTPAPGADAAQSDIRLGSLTPFLSHDSLDRNLDPRRGRRIAIATELTARQLGGDVNTVKPFLDYRQFFTLGVKEGAEPWQVPAREPRVIGVRLRASHVAGYGRPFRPEQLSSIDGVPVFKRFFLGGETEVRGYDVNSIAPLARVDRFLVTDSNHQTLISSQTLPIGGDTEVVLNAEYRVPILWRFSTAVFFDYGSSFNARGLKEERFETPTQPGAPGSPATILTVLHPLSAAEGGLPSYRISLGGELRFQVPVLNLPLRLILAVNPNAQTRPPTGSLLAPEKRVTFRFGFGRTL